MKVIVISGSPRKSGMTSILMSYVLEYVKQKDVEVKFINLAEDGFECYRGDPSEFNYEGKILQAARDVTESDVWLVGVPVYNSMFSAALKNLFEFVSYKETEGKTAGLAIVSGGMISFGDVQTLFTQLMSYFRVITNPTAVYVQSEKFVDGKIADEEVKSRLEKMVDKTLELAKRNN
tara:strand:- start:14112 stop:14642 length:531 start_codon:yes stop_codon:yes gene_type:complete